MSRFDRLRTLVRARGWSGALKLAIHRAYSARWERRLGVITSGHHPLQDEGFGNPDFRDHSASSVLDLQRALSMASIAPANEVFVDFGSGKGRALLVAAMRPFRRVIGVELSPHLSRVALQNVQLARPHLRCRDIRVETMGADQYEIPADANLLYFYNPFTGPVMTRVVENLRRSLAAAPREVIVVIASPAALRAGGGGAVVGLRRQVVQWAETPRPVPLHRALRSVARPVSFGATSAHAAAGTRFG